MTTRQDATARRDATPMDMSWRPDARCLGADTAAFFRGEGTRGPARESATHEARRLCQACPVAISCVVEAVRMGDHHGIRGGLDLDDEDDRRIARKIARKNGVAV